MARPLGSKNRKTLLREAEAKAMLAGTAGGPKALPTMTRILKWHLDRADREQAKGADANPAIIEAAFAEARTTANMLLQFQVPKLSAVAVGAVTKMVVTVRGGLPPRDTS